MTVFERIWTDVDARLRRCLLPPEYSYHQVETTTADMATRHRWKDLRQFLFFRWYPSPHHGS